MGWAATRLRVSPDRITFVESMAVAVFGAFIGGEFVAVQLRSDPKDTAISLLAIVLAAVCSVAALALLGVMRRAVGPLRSGKSKVRR